MDPYVYWDGDDLCAVEIHGNRCCVGGRDLTTALRYVKIDDCTSAARCGSERRQKDVQRTDCGWRTGWRSGRISRNSARPSGGYRLSLVDDKMARHGVFTGNQPRVTDYRGVHSDYYTFWSTSGLEPALIWVPAYCKRAPCDRKLGQTLQNLMLEWVDVVQLFRHKLSFYGKSYDKNPCIYLLRILFYRALIVWNFNVSLFCTPFLYFETKFEFIFVLFFFN